jgi:DNA repair protein RadC
MDFGPAIAFDRASDASRPSMRDLREAMDWEVVAAMLGGGKGADKAAKALMLRFGGFARLMAAQVDELAAVADVSPAAARAFHAAQVAAERVALGQIAKRCVISSWSALLTYVKVSNAGRDTEQFRVLFLDKKNQLIADDVMGVGTVDHAPVYVREIARRALQHAASAVILVHNHPSGDPTPSSADVEMTRQVAAGLKTLSIQVHDHIVAGVEGVASLKALGLF